MKYTLKRWCSDIYDMAMFRGPCSVITSASFWISIAALLIATIYFITKLLK